MPRCTRLLNTFAAATVAGALLTTTGAIASDEHGHAPAKPAEPAPKPAAPSKPTASKPAASKPGPAASKPAPAAEPKERDTALAAKDTKDAMGKPAAASDSDVSTPPTAEMALTMLREGNARWVANKSTAPNTDPSRRSALAEQGQKPFVTVLTCADSRLPVERLFDRGVGDVFVVRVAGNVAGGSETGTIEYGVGHLKTPLLVVMGHTKCGAVAAAASGAEVHGKVAQIVASIEPAVERARRNNPDADATQLAALAVKENVWQSMFDLFKNSPDVRAAMGKGELKVVGAVCDIATGKVEFMGEHPWQAELVSAMNERARQAGGGEASAHGE